MLSVTSARRPTIVLKMTMAGEVYGKSRAKLQGVRNPVLSWLHRHRV
jgi:hypothetical protein